MFDPEDRTETPETILRPEVFVNATGVDIEQEVREAAGTEAAPSGCPDGRQLALDCLGTKVLQWGHASRLSGHPGNNRTLTFIQRKFWWPGMRGDIVDSVVACSVCAQAKSPHQSPQGLLQPLPIPHRLWSHIVLDFVTVLPSSNHHTTILTIVDRFSKAVHFIPLTINGHTSAASKLSPFECCLGYQSPLFPSQEVEVGVSSAAAFIRRCKRTWRATRTNLVRAVERMKQQADRRWRLAPTYRVGQRM